MDIAYLGDDVGITFAWISASDELGDDAIKHTNGNVVPASFWMIDQPNHRQGHDCVRMCFSEKKYQLATCDSPNNFVCELYGN